jgi:exosortase
MTQASATTGAAPSSENERGLPFGLTARGLAAAIPIAGAFLWLFLEVLLRQHQFSTSEKFGEDWKHAYLVPLVSLYMLWLAKDEIARRSSRLYWPGLLPVLAGILLYYFFLIGPLSNHMFSGGGMILTLFGIALLFAGPSMMRLLFVPIAYLAFGLTISEQVMITITGPLQSIAAIGSHWLLSVLYTTEISGNTLVIVLESGREIPLNIAEACSGMRMVIAFLALGAAVAFIACDQWWQRAMLILLAVPVAIFVNVLRVSSLGIASIVNPDFAAGDAHMFIGTLWLIPGFLLYMGVVWALKKVAEDPSAKGAA